MQQVTITQYTYRPAVQDFVGNVTGIIEVDEGGARVRSGGQGWLQVRVPDPETNGSIGAEDDPLRWAELLPEFIAGGDTEVVVREIAAEQTQVAELPDVATPAVAALAAAVRPR